MTRDYRQLHIWQEAHTLTLDLYKATKRFPSFEPFGLARQICRASASIGANIAEGCGQKTSALLRRYLLIALGSIKEVEYHLLLAYEVGYVPKEEYLALDNRIKSLGRMTNSFISRMPRHLAIQLDQIPQKT